MTLDDELREMLNLLLPIYADSYALEKTRVRKQMETNRIIAQIKQAFADEGYYKPQVFSENAGNFTGTDGGYTDIRLTGRKWLARFEKELYEDNTVSLKRNILIDLIKAVLGSPHGGSSVELWKLYIDAALDQLDSSVNKEAARRAAGVKDE